MAIRTFPSICSVSEEGNPVDAVKAARDGSFDTDSENKTKLDGAAISRL